jgi:hypothetical protein
MNEDITIPPGHWTHDGIHNWRNYASYWEAQLRAAMTREPDPQARFGAWLTELAETGHSTAPKLTFYEQPYLMWAKAVYALRERDEKETRERIAYEIANPAPD